MFEHGCCLMGRAESDVSNVDVILVLTGTSRIMQVVQWTCRVHYEIVAHPATVLHLLYWTPLNNVCWELYRSRISINKMCPHGFQTDVLLRW